MKPIHRGILVVLGGYLRGGEMEIVINHLEGGMPQDLFQAEDITPVKQVVGSESMAAKVGMQPCDTRSFSKPREHQLQRIYGYRPAG